MQPVGGTGTRTRPAKYNVADTMGGLGAGRWGEAGWGGGEGRKLVVREAQRTQSFP